MSAYSHCKYRNSWNCTNGYCNCENCNCEKCDDFKLDSDTLTKKQQRTIKRILSYEDKKQNKTNNLY